MRGVVDLKYFVRRGYWGYGKINDELLIIVLDVYWSIYSYGNGHG